MALSIVSFQNYCVDEFEIASLVNNKFLPILFAAIFA